MISIIIPIYNSELYLRECLESISAQSYPDFEVICVDDGSADKSRVICLDFSCKDNRFRYIYQKNGGVSKARNTGLNNSEGDYVCFIDSDDIIDKDFLNNLIYDIKEYDLVICDYSRKLSLLGNKGNGNRMYDSKTYINDIVYERTKHPNICMMLFKSDFIHQNNLQFTEGCVRKEDAEFFLKYMSHCNRILWIDYIGYFYRDNQASAMYNDNLKSLTGIEAAMRIKEYLVNRDIIEKQCPIVEAGIQEFIYHLSRRNNFGIYEYIHSKYNVRNVMKSLLRFPRKSRSLVALVYLILGKNVFFKILSLIFPE